MATPNIGGEIPIDVHTNQNIGGDTSPASPAGLTPMLTWIAELRYLRIYFVNYRTSKCSVDAAKRGFYGAINSIFFIVGRIASEEVVLHLTTSKCMPILLHGLEALPLNKSQLSSLDFTVNPLTVSL